MKSRNKTAFALIAGTVCTLTIAGSAHATSETLVVAPQVSSDEEIRYVDYSDLNIRSDAGMAMLMGRIERAAREVCGSEDYRRAGSSGRASRNAQCQEGAIADALSQLPAYDVASIR
jgi:UrcA family protein